MIEFLRSMRAKLRDRRRRRRRKRRPAAYDLDRKLEPYLSFDGGFFLEAGANDGYHQSNTFQLEKHRGWTGILVEGIPSLYERCRVERPASRVYHCALVAPEDCGSVVTMHHANLMSVVEGSMRTSAAQADYLARGRKEQRHTEADAYSVEVPARTLNSILEEQSEPVSIDFMSLDVEGSEVAALRGLDLDRFAPKLILVEGKFFFEEIDAILQPRYELLDRLTVHDYLYRLRSAAQ